MEGDVSVSAGTHTQFSTAITAKLESIGNSGDSVLEEVVEEEHIVMQGVEEQQVVMLTDSETGHQQIVITGGRIVSGPRMIQIQSEDGQSILMDARSLKTEPEDLRVAVKQAGQTVDLEEGAQAIQASATACVQNVIRSLNMNGLDKEPLTTIVPSNLLSQDRLTNLVIEEESPLDQSLNDSPPAKRSRCQNIETPRVFIAKQYQPFGFHVTLEAATAQWVRKEEDRCTYLNKGQFYGVTLEYRTNPAESIVEDLSQVKSVVMLVFRDAKNPDDELNAWEFWHQRQPTSKQRILDAETNNLTEQCGITLVEDIAYNAIAVYWNPLEKPAFLSVAIQCLSTDFSLQKGVKGLPMHLQVDTYTKVDTEYEMVHRAYCQVKVFCDKGAERKFRQEERRAARKVAVGGQRVLDMYHQCQDRSEFYCMVDLSRVPVLYNPSNCSPSSILEAAAVSSSSSPSAGISILKTNSVIDQQQRRRKSFPPPESRMVVYVRQENEEIFTPLHLVPPTVPGLARAIEAKYNVSATAIRYLYRRNTKGITAKLDDDLLKFYCNEDTFLMQVTAIELEGAVTGQDTIMYDITLCELSH